VDIAKGTGRAFAIIGLMLSMTHAFAQARSINIVSGTYGGNCGAKTGNATRDLIRQCNGRDTCAYRLDARRIRASQRACPKDLRADWQCSDREFHTAMLSPEVGADSVLVLSCVEQRGPGH
jgi:hypothetical protein